MREQATEARLLEIYWETVAALYGYASRRCGGDRELAEDVVQQTWLRAVREWRRKGVPGIPVAWLTTVARNRIVDQLRRRETVPLESVSATDVLAAVDQNDVSDSAEIASAVSHALARLPKDEAQLLESFHFDRYKMSQLATSYGISERAIAVAAAATRPRSTWPTANGNRPRSARLSPDRR